MADDLVNEGTLISLSEGDRLIKEETLISIADAIRQGTGSTEPILTEDMAQGVTSAYDAGRKLFTGRIDNTLVKVTADELVGAMSINSHAFFNASNLQDIEIPKGIYALNPYCFANSNANQSKLKKVTLTESHVNYIGDYIFNNCNRLVAFCLQKHTKTPSVSSKVFGTTNDFAKIIVSNAMVETFKTATNWVNLAYRIVGADPNDEIGIIDINYPDGTFMMSFPFIKGKTWEEMMGTDMFAIYSPDIEDYAIHHFTENGSGDGYYGNVVLEYDVGSRGYELDGVKMDMLITEGTYTTTEVGSW